MANHFGSTMRVVHRYLGFFLAGIMAVYAVSGMVMIFRDTDFLKQENSYKKTEKPGLSDEQLGKALAIKELRFSAVEGDIAVFKEGTYNKVTGVAEYKIKELPVALNKMTKLHKAKSKEPLFFLNLFFGISLLFFVLSSFWMFMPQTAIFKKGMYFTIAGILLTLLLLFR